MDNNNKDLIIPNQNEFLMIENISKRAAVCGLYGGVGNENKIFMVLLAAREMGIPCMQALNGGIWNINGKIEISSRLMSSMIRRHGHSIVVKQCDSKACILEGKRKDNGDTFTASFTIEDAKTAGLAGRDVWKKYTEDMLYNRAMSRLARRLFPDVIGTAYVEGEIRDADYEIVEPIQNKEEIKNLELTPEEIEMQVNDFIFNFPDENPELIKSYLDKYSKHYKKSVIAAIADYSNHENFMNDFNKFKNRETPKS